MQSGELRKKIAKLFTGETDPLYRFILTSSERLQNRVSFTGATQALIHALSVKDDIRDTLLMTLAASGDTVVVGFNYGGRRMMGDHGMARVDWLQHLAKMDEATDWTRKISKAKTYFECVADGREVEDFEGRLGWLRKKFPKATERIDKFIGNKIQGSAIENKMGALESMAQKISIVDYGKLNEAHHRKIKRDNEHAVDEMLHPAQKAKTTAGTGAARKTESSQYEQLYAIIGDVNTLFVEKIASGYYEEVGIRMIAADEYKDKFDASKNDIASVLAEDNHFLNHMFDNMNLDKVHNIVLDEILQNRTFGGYSLGQDYIEELLMRIKDEFA